jgi:hypothetical protein
MEGEEVCREESEEWSRIGYEGEGGFRWGSEGGFV